MHGCWSVLLMQYCFNLLYVRVCKCAHATGWVYGSEDNLGDRSLLSIFERQVSLLQFAVVVHQSSWLTNSREVSCVHL